VIHDTPTDRTVAHMWAHIDKAGPIPTWAPFLGPCWVWTGSTNRSERRQALDGHPGYGQIQIGQRKVLVHRYLYETSVEVIPEGLVLDHLCRVTRCVRPDHLEPVTQRENLLRGLTGNSSARRRAA